VARGPEPHPHRRGSSPSRRPTTPARAGTRGRGRPIGSGSGAEPRRAFGRRGRSLSSPGRFSVRRCVCVVVGGAVGVVVVCCHSSKNLRSFVVGDDAVLGVGGRTGQVAVRVLRPQARADRVPTQTRAAAPTGVALREAAGSPVGSSPTTTASLVVPGTPAVASNVAASAATATRFAAAPSASRRVVPTTRLTVPGRRGVPRSTPRRRARVASIVRRSCHPVGSIGNIAGFDSPTVAYATTDPRRAPYAWTIETPVNRVGGSFTFKPPACASRSSRYAPRSVRSNPPAPRRCRRRRPATGPRSSRWRASASRVGAGGARRARPPQTSSASEGRSPSRRQRPAPPAGGRSRRAGAPRPGRESSPRKVVASRIATPRSRASATACSTDRPSPLPRRAAETAPRRGHVVPLRKRRGHPRPPERMRSRVLLINPLPHAVRTGRQRRNAHVPRPSSALQRRAELACRDREPCPIPGSPNSFCQRPGDDDALPPASEGDR